MSHDNQTSERLQSQDVFEEMYVAFANILVTDLYIKKLLADGSYVFDFLPFEAIKAVYTKPQLSTIPADTPHINPIINRMGYQLVASNSKRGEIEMVIVYKSPMHREATYKLMSYLTSKLADTTFMTCKDSKAIESDIARIACSISFGTFLNRARRTVKTAFLPASAFPSAFPSAIHASFRSAVHFSNIVGIDSTSTRP